MSESTCRDCGVSIHQQQEKAIGEPRDRAYQIVWADVTEGGWVCPVTGNEHVPGVPRRLVQVTVKFGENETMVWLTLAEAGNFVFRPIQEALDDGEAAWQLHTDNPERHTSLNRWATDLYGVTR